MMNIDASVMKLANMTDLKSVGFGLVGSSPTIRTISLDNKQQIYHHINMKLIANIIDNKIVFVCRCSSEADVRKAYKQTTMITGPCDELSEDEAVNGGWSHGVCKNGSTLQVFEMN